MSRRGLLMLLVASAALLALAASATAQTDPPGIGEDWVVKDFTYYNSDHLLTGNLSVESNGRLQLDAMTLTMAPERDGALTISVEAGSTLELTNVSILSNNPNRHFWFECRGPVIIRDCDIRDVASNDRDWDAWDEIAGGVQIYDGSSILVDSEFHDSQRINVYVYGCDPIIRNCEFYNSEYVSTFEDDDYSYEVGYVYGFYTDATGLYLAEASPNITGCTFRNNGLYTSAYPFYNPSYYYNVVMTWGRGILAYESAPNITDCYIQNNGEQPLRRNVAGITQEFYDRPFYYSDGITEGGVVCIGSQAHPRIVRCNIIANDVFGIFGMDGGYPALVESCYVTNNRYVREVSPGQSIVFSPSAGIQVDDGSGTMYVANSSFKENAVYANIWMNGPSLDLFNYSNSNNAVTGAYNIYLASGRHYFEKSFFDGDSRSEVDRNIYISSSGNQAPRVRMEDCVIYGGRYGVYCGSYQGSYVYIANSTIRDNSQATFFVYTANIDCVNCTIPSLRIDGYAYGRGAMVRIMYFLDIYVTWQNDLEIPGAFVQVFNATKDFVYGGITDENGTVLDLVVPSKIIQVNRGSQNEFSNSPLYLNAYSAGLYSIEYKEVFIENSEAFIVIEDETEPTIYVFTPGQGFAQNDRMLEVRGMCTDVGAGVHNTSVSIDGETWELAGAAEKSWNTVLNLTEGTYTIYVRAYDKAGNNIVEKVENVIIDLSPPMLEVLDPVKQVWFTSQTNYTLRGKVIGQVSLTINRQRVDVMPDGSWETTQEIHSGSNDFHLEAIDHVGNVHTIMKSIVRDSTVPKLILTSPEEGTWTNISQEEVKGITELGATIRVNGEPIQTFDGRFATTIYLTEGINDVFVEAIDKANNIMRVVRRVHLDSIPPQVRVESPQGDMMVTDRLLPIRGTIDDPSVQHVIVNGLLVPVVDMAFDKEFRLDEGLNTINIEVWDKARNYVSRTYRIVLDTTPPLLDIQEPGLRLETRDPTVRIRGLVDVDATLYMWADPLHEDFDLIDLIRLQNTFRYDELPLVPGLNMIHIEAEDDVGNTAHLLLEVVYDLEPPELIISPVVETTTSELVTVSGLLKDGNEVRIRGVPAVLGPNGGFEESVHLEKGLNAIEVEAFDIAGNQLTVVVNVTRTSVEPPTEGIMGAGLGLSIGLVIVMLVIGLLIVYPGVSSGAIEPAAMGQEPIIVTEEDDQAPAPGPAVMAPPETPPPPEAPPRTSSDPTPPDRPRRPLPPPPPPEDGEEPTVPPKPPWR